MSEIATERGLEMETMVRLCVNNRPLGDQGIRGVRREFPGRVTVEPCVGYCGECCTDAFALYKRKLITADDPEELLILLREQIGEMRSGDIK